MDGWMDGWMDSEEPLPSPLLSRSTDSRYSHCCDTNLKGHAFLVLQSTLTMPPLQWRKFFLFPVHILDNAVIEPKGEQRKKEGRMEIVASLSNTQKPARTSKASLAIYRGRRGEASDLFLCFLAPRSTEHAFMTHSLTPTAAEQSKQRRPREIAFISAD